MAENLIDRLRTEANCIDDTGDVELRRLLSDAAAELERLKPSTEYADWAKLQAEFAEQQEGV